MRILHILDHSLPLHSGYSFRTASIIREQRMLGWETVHLTTPRQNSNGEDHEIASDLGFYRTSLKSTPVQRIPVFGGYLAEMISTSRRIGELISRFKPDILHAHSPVLTALPALNLGRKFGLPIVYEVRALWEDGAVDLGTTYAGSARYRATRAMESYVMRNVGHVTTICEGLRSEIISRGISESRVTVIPNAVDSKSFVFNPPVDISLRTRFNLEGKTVIGFIGSFYGYEGLELLIESFALISRRRPDLRLLFAGGGPREKQMQELVKQLGIGEAVIFLGRVPHAEVQGVYSVLDILAYPRLPARVTELVTPLKPLEAMAQGRIVVASDVGGHRELIRDGETGYLFSAGDRQALAFKLEQTISARSDWPRILNQARIFVETERTWALSVGRYRSVYEGLTKGPEQLSSKSRKGGE